MSLSIRNKILMIGAKHLLGWKVCEILKRDFSVVEIQEEDAPEDSEQRVLKDIPRFMAFMGYQQIQTVVVSSEILADRDISYADACQLIDTVIAEKKKLIYLFLHRVAEGENSFEVLASYRYNGAGYYKKAEALKKRILCGEDHLVVELDCCYGFSGLLHGLNIVGASKELQGTTGALAEGSDTIYPILADEVGLWLSEHMNEQGLVRFDQVRGMKCQEWMEIAGEKPDMQPCYQPYEERKDGRFSDIREGYLVEAHQERCVFNLVYKYSHHETLKGKNIGAFRYALGCELAHVIHADARAEIDFVSPVPKTGMYYAMGLAAELGIPYIQTIDKTSSNIRSFQVRNTDKRKEILWGKLRPIPSLLEGKNVAVVDEAIFTGTTLKVVCEMLRECGVNRIYLCIPTPKCRYHCDYLVWPKRDMLLEYMNEEMLLDYFDADAVFFQEDQRFLDEIKVFGDICTDCFFGRNV